MKHLDSAVRNVTTLNKEIDGHLDVCWWMSEML